MRVQRLDIRKPWRKQDLGGKRPEKSVCIVRYGAFGDLIQASSVFPYFKENGWHVTVNTTPAGFDIIKHDPHVDAVFLQETGQVRNKELSDYWDALGSNFERLVQFSESIEGALLAVPGRPEFDLDPKEWHRRVNVDYYHRMHEIAGADLPPRPRFYPSKAEKKWAEQYRMKLGADNFVILWALSGSSVHKAYPYMDTVIARLMIEHPEIRVVFVGDGLCQLLEENWRKEKRVIRKSNRWSIRETFSFAQQADLVIGPETGVLNAVSYEDIPKIIFLSHSSPVNIGGNWPNTTVLMPYGASCYPCHKMHYDFSTCNRDEATGGALCAAKISPDRVYEAIEEVMKVRKAA